MAQNQKFRTPKRCFSWWIRPVRKVHFGLFMLYVVIVYVLFNLFFAGLYALIDAFETKAFLDYVYSSFMISFTVGAHNYYPVNDIGKFFAIVHVCLSVFGFALLVSVITARLFYTRNNFEFSSSVFHDISKNIFGVRIINIQRDPLINPEIRVSLLEHNGPGSSPSYYLVRTCNEIPFLGICDYTLLIDDSRKRVRDAISRARNQGTKSDFRLVVSISGHNGMQQACSFHEYTVDCIEEGVKFKEIEYKTENVSDDKIIKYSKIPNFWPTFHTIVKKDGSEG